ncbi:putative amidohydrolase [Bacillus mesophilus]|uniref:Carbon-nitrogen family hydrolase n=1 Tax=Bacillus mesophilus TaxID=1808955 RepID=A0A6M0Q507_9BACI|nr:carbon-nitrogen family hydrolase [Bacillus mesophilus]MBM7659652.1 putative amidohydrolase [Bacillus mesophilus]NEY70520.1 carbon-nitrogen family hydrolase [Bacillus mesophilus]
MNLKVSCIQFDITFGNPEQNFKRMREKIEKAALEQPDIIVLPELWTTGYDLTRLDEIADHEGKETLSFLSQIAKENNVHIVGGSIAKSTDEGVYNTMYIISKDGSLVTEYSKLHLFKLMDEHHYLQAGSSEGLFKLDDINCAGFICYDIRFPEWIRKHTSSGAEVLFVVAEWPAPRLNHWRSLLISRAIENQCYVVACNRAGNDPKNEFAGHSMIIDPWGEIIAEATEVESILSGEISTDKVQSVRKQIPIFLDRRPEFY